MSKFVILISIIVGILSCNLDNSGTEICNTLDCQTFKFNILTADIDGSNIVVVAKSTYQDMTHPRVSDDKKWVMYTTYNNLNTDGCASLDSGYVNTEIKAVRVDGSQSVGVIGKTEGELTSNNYFYGASGEFTYLGGTPGNTELFRASIDSSMAVTGGSTVISGVPGTVTPFDPSAHNGTGKIVFGGQYDSSGLVKSIIIMNISDGSSYAPLSLSRDHAGNILYGADAFENDPKISPDGDKVVFMRYAPNAGANGFGWHLFVVDVGAPLNETDISYAHLGASQLVHDILPEWIDNDTLIFANIDSSTVVNTRTIYTMKDDGTSRSQIILPVEFRYSDVFPYLDVLGQQKIVISAEKLDTECSQ